MVIPPPWRSTTRLHSVSPITSAFVLRMAVQSLEHLEDAILICGIDTDALFAPDSSILAKSSQGWYKLDPSGRPDVSITRRIENQ